MGLLLWKIRPIIISLRLEHRMAAFLSCIALYTLYVVIVDLVFLDFPGPAKVRIQPKTTKPLQRQCIAIFIQFMGQTTPMYNIELGECLELCTVIKVSSCQTNCMDVFLFQLMIKRV